MERLYECPDLWDSWMRLQWPSFRERIPAKPNVESIGMAVVNAGCQISDVLALTEAFVRDLIDGYVDDKALKAKYLSKSVEAYAALYAVISKLRNGG